MYANESLKRIVVSMAGCKGFAETLLELKPEKLLPVMDEVQRINDAAEKILLECEKGLDPDQVRGLIRYADNHILSVVSNANPQAERDYYTVSQEALDRLLLDVTSACAFCAKIGKEIKKCQRRRDLLECGIIPQGEKECPYN